MTKRETMLGETDSNVKSATIDAFILLYFILMLL